MANNEKRYYVHDRKVSDLSRFSAVNVRYWVIDRTTNLPVDEGSTKRSAQMGADLLNSQV
jgi:hypothetical protein